MSGYIVYGDGFKAERLGGEDFVFEVYVTDGFGRGCSCKVDMSDLDAVYVTGLGMYQPEVQKVLMKTSIQFAQAFVTQIQEDELAAEAEERDALEDRLDLIREAKRLP